MTGPCEDGDPCTVGDSCSTGECKPGIDTPNCDDGNPCTWDSCKSKVGCIHGSNQAVPCNDANACTDIDVCAESKCYSGSPLACDDDNPCTDDWCDPLQGCMHKNNTSPCDDGNACTGFDVCTGGTCVAQNTISCDDANVCTNDICDPKTGCLHDSASGTSTTTLSVTSDVQTDASATQKIVNGQMTFVNFKSAVPTWADSPAWTAKIPGATWIWTEAQVSNPTQTSMAMFVRTFDMPSNATILGATLWVAADNTLSCAINGKPIIQSSQPNNASAAVALQAGNHVTLGANEVRCIVQNTGVAGATGTTNPAGLLYRLDVNFSLPSKLCNDANACTSIDVCLAGQCVGLAGLKCDDGNPCTSDSCDPLVGCGHGTSDGAACSDSNPCTAGDTCASGKCVPAGPASCDDANLCTEDLCDVKAGCIQSAVAGGVKEKLSFVSDESVQVALKFMEGPSGPIVIESKSAVPTWDNFAGWTHDIPGATWIWKESVVSDAESDSHTLFIRTFSIPVGATDLDGALLIATDNTYYCSLNQKLVGVSAELLNFTAPTKLPLTSALKGGDNMLVCAVKNAGQTGATGFTNPAGLLYRVDVQWNKDGTGTQCDDGNACTEGDWCEGDICAPGGIASCDDANACTDDFCDPKKGCVHVPNAASACDDGNACTTGDVCAAGACMGGPSLACDDGNLCTSDACDPVKGCVHASLEGKACDDGSACTIGDTCSKGLCGGASALGCDDANACTLDGCDPKTGCTHAPADGASCDDGNPCTSGDSCTNAQCIGATPTSCDDGNACTLEVCDSVKGCLYGDLSGTACDDGNPCTVADSCKSGACTGGVPKLCTDGESCTVDTCETSSGKCVFAAVLDGTKCEDGNACTLNDACQTGKCVGGLPRSCTDGNPCTTDNCDPATGLCFNDVITEPWGCDDANPCTEDDVCTKGTCGGTPKKCDDGNACTADVCSTGSGQCLYKPLADGTPCNDKAGTCKKGVCQ